MAERTPFEAKWRLLAQVEFHCHILISNVSGAVKVAPLRILQFPVVLPHKFQDAGKFNLQFSDFSEITETADKLRWLRYQRGLRQRDSFRPSYGMIGDFIQALPNRPQTIACTATATKQERQEIQQTLGMRNCVCHCVSVYRENLYLTVREVGHLDQMPAAVLSELEDWNWKGLALVFCPTVLDVQSLTKYLESRDWRACGYYAEMSKKEKEACANDYADGKYNVMIATSAFGLGVDIPNICLVIHAGLPLGLSDYTQQIGRGGRNGKKTRCILLYAPGDEKRALRILKGNAGEDVSPIKKHGVAALVKAIQSSDCLWGSITKYYGERMEVSCGHCTQCRRKNNIA